MHLYLSQAREGYFGCMVIDGYYGDSSIGWRTPVDAIVDFKHDTSWAEVWLIGSDSEGHSLQHLDAGGWKEGYEGE